MEYYPNVLIINGQSIYKRNATGITLRNIIGCFPPENIFEIYLDEKYERDKDSADIYSLSVADCFPFQKMMRKNQANTIAMTCNINRTSNSMWKNLIKKRIRRICINIADMSPMKFKSEYLKIINKFSPDIIYTLGASIAVMKLSLAVSKYFDIPILLHIMDDWPHFLQDDKGLGQKYYKRKLQKYFKKCIRRSKRGLAIGPQMADYFEKETDITYDVLMNPADVSRSRCHKKELSEPIVFTYAGGMHLQRDKALMEISYVLEQISKEKKIDIELHIYTNLDSYNGELKHFSNCTRFFDYVEHEKIKAVYEAADILVHTETSCAELLGFFRFSISTKISEYLASNRPVLFYGPREMGLFDYLQSNGIAYTASSKVELEYTLKDMLGDRNKRVEVTQKAYEFVMLNQNLENVKDTFRHALLKSIEEWNSSTD